MNRKYPVYTSLAQCQDCYKCVRECPVKAIRVENHHASVMSDLCVSCGHCVEVCPVGAKHIREDINRLRHMLNAGNKVYVSLAPSWVCEFPEINPSAMIGALKQLGFAGVSETAIGAEVISDSISEFLAGQESGLYISTACPAAVEYIRKYKPLLCDNMTRLSSPLQAHCKMLRKEYGEDIKVVFFGPCAAKKIEADNYSRVVDLALTFIDLRDLLEESKVNLLEYANGNDSWSLGTAGWGHYYPIEGGMNRTIESNDNAELVCISGLDKFQHELGVLQGVSAQKPVFLELLACSGGCVNGPAMTNNKQAGLAKRLQVLKDIRSKPDVIDRDGLAIEASFESAVVSKKTFSDFEIKRSLAEIDKHSHADELNCGGCGYETCRDFACALLEGNAEPDMCVSFMRTKAQNKANALLRSMPSGVVIVNNKLEIIECNKPFAEMFDEDTQTAFGSLNSLEGANVSHIVPFVSLFRLALHNGEDICRQRYVADNRVFNLTIFSIQKGQVAGAVIQDVTEVQWQRQQIAKKAREVLRKNLATVQNIACSLGEHMADTEVLLNSIANSYTEEDEGEENGSAI